MKPTTDRFACLRHGLAGLVAAAWLAAPAMAQVTDHLGLPGPIDLAGERYALAWSSQPSGPYIKQEYVPAGQTVEAYEQMILIETVTAGIGVMDAVAAQVARLDQRRATDPLVNMELIRNEGTGEAMLDFILSSQDADGEYIVEWNAYRYAPHTDAAGEAGVLLFGVSHRAYGNAAAQTFLQGLPALRSAQMDALARAPLPRPAG